MTDDLTPHGEPDLAELADTAHHVRRRGAKPFVAAVAALAIGAAAVAVVAASGGDKNEPVPLALQNAAGGSTDANAENDKATLGAPSDLIYPMFEYRYVLAGALADLGDEAPVYRLVAPTLSATDIANMAEALDIQGDVASIEGGGWEVSDVDRTVQVSGDGSGWYISVWNGPSYRTSSGSSDGSTGSEDSGDGTSSDGAGPSVGCETTIDPDTPVDSTVAPSTGDPSTGDPSTGDPSTGDPGVEEPIAIDDCALVDPIPEPQPLPEPLPAPEDLPSDGEAIDIARDMLRALGALDGDWTFEVMDGTMMDTAVACEPAADGVCVDDGAEPVVMSRSVMAHRLVDGRPVIGLDWYVDIGDHGVVQSVGGVLADIEPLADYPLRSTTDVFDDLQSGDAGYFGGPLALDASGAAEIECPENAKCASPEPACIEGCPEPEVVEITITDVSLGAQVWYATVDDGSTVQYVVPTYHFSGSMPDGTEWSSDLLAIADEYVTSTSAPSGGVIDPAPVPEPGVADADGDDASDPPSGGAEVDVTAATKP